MTGTVFLLPCVLMLSFNSIIPELPSEFEILVNVAFGFESTETCKQPLLQLFFEYGTICGYYFLASCALIGCTIVALSGFRVIKAGLKSSSVVHHILACVAIAIIVSVAIYILVYCVFPFLLGLGPSVYAAILTLLGVIVLYSRMKKPAPDPTWYPPGQPNPDPSTTSPDSTGHPPGTPSPEPSAASPDTAGHPPEDPNPEPSTTDPSWHPPGTPAPESSTESVGSTAPAPSDPAPSCGSTNNNSITGSC